MTVLDRAWRAAAKDASLRSPWLGHGRLRPPAAPRYPTRLGAGHPPRPATAAGAGRIAAPPGGHLASPLAPGRPRGAQEAAGRGSSALSLHQLRPRQPKEQPWRPPPLAAQRSGQTCGLAATRCQPRAGQAAAPDGGSAGCAAAWPPAAAPHQASRAAERGAGVIAWAGSRNASASPRTGGRAGGRQPAPRPAPRPRRGENGRTAAVAWPRPGSGEASEPTDPPGLLQRMERHWEGCGVVRNRPWVMCRALQGAVAIASSALSVGQPKLPGNLPASKALRLLCVPRSCIQVRRELQLRLEVSVLAAVGAAIAAQISGSSAAVFASSSAGSPAPHIAAAACAGLLRSAPASS